ncbi:Mcm2-7 hexameric complex component [Pleodorina starrii]|uniref:DNA replication licensing factor MCM7 n=1 Tax=Pleodorina starrii TaxID=330485 RepID=A0A9W6BAZ3_9CHLO|nr:Mcm2-7 hexameric complex component [Pleodorina starrii]GLC48460.1 Mcm2-7 hexameric complex component [Pleodorina starrii]GLC71780.1 Mcm2-7 hexameric complex component [Pleodorina starrii]
MANAHPNHAEAARNCEMFLQNFMDPESDDKAKYMQQLQEIANRRSKVLAISLDDVEAFFLEVQPQQPGFVAEIERNTRMYQKLMAEAADRLMPPPDVNAANVKKDVYDILSEHRKIMDGQMRANEARETGQGRGGAAPGTVRGGCPDILLRRFDMYFLPRTKMPALPMRSVRATHLGHLVRVRGIVTHVTDVKPLVSVVAYTDPETGYEVYQEVTGRTFRPLDNDTKERAKVNRKMQPVMETRGSKFVKFQEARLQELAEEVPEGATPRTLSVHLMGEVTRSMKPGDDVTITGIFLPEQYTGFRAMRAGLLMSTYLEAHTVVQSKRQYGSAFELSEAEVAAIEELGESGDVYGRLARSIAPEIFGMEDVKKALLLMMVGGQTRVFPDGLKLRGDVHVCLMGDPGVAKSQLLKYVSRVMPRAVYTTGKGSSGVGLTAAVLRNQVTKELVLEGGALVLADKGVCCIDEFDKMEEGDRTAIHEVMEQQTVSIAKAGITTTLNTRTTILAAANPAYGRYDRRRSPSENINLPAALLSRFDLLWLLLDESSKEQDTRLANHIVSLHVLGRAPVAEAGAEEDPATAPVPLRLLRAYIGQARQYEPDVPEQLTEYIASFYAELRQMEKAALGAAATYTTPRTLLSILRLSQALARLRFSNLVEQGDVDEALRLMRQTKASLENSGPGGGAGDGAYEDAVSLVYRLIREYSSRTGELEVPYAKIQELTQRHNVSRENIEECVTEYARIALWTVERDQLGQPVLQLQINDSAFA